jgi:hypothetical protein
MGVEAGKVSPSFYLSVERFVNIEGNVCDAGANPIIVKVHLEDTGSSNTTRAVHDDIVFEDKLRL